MRHREAGVVVRGGGDGAEAQAQFGRRQGDHIADDPTRLTTPSRNGYRRRRCERAT